MPTKKSQKGRPVEVDKDKLLDIAATLFAERGFEGTTTRELARRTKCNVAMICYHFGSKEGLYHAVLLKHFKRLRGTYEASTEQTQESPEELAKCWPELVDHDTRQLCAALYSVGLLVVLDERMPRILFREMMSGGKNIVRIFNEGEVGLVGPIQKTLEKLVEKGQLSKELDLQIATIGLFGPFVYSNIAGPVIRDVYQLGGGEDYVRKLSIHLTKSLFAAWRVQKK